MTGTCLCGAVRVSIDAKPDYIHDCNCSLCRKSGAAWGYFTGSSAQADGDTEAYVREDKAVPTVEIHSCRQCGTTTHFRPTSSFRQTDDSTSTLGVNMKLFDPDALTGVEVRYPDGKQWNGQGPFGYRRAALEISTASPW